MDQHRAPAREQPPTGGPTYDDSEWPLFIARMPPKRLSDADFETHLKFLREPFRRREPFAVLIVLGDHPPLGPTQRKAAAEAMITDSRSHPGLLRAKAIVIGSAIERGVVTAVGWMAKPPYPFAAFESESAARNWLTSQLGR